jgi:hypothetical protein
MLRSVRMGVALATCALLFSTLAAPVSAGGGSGTAVIVNGIPGQKVDLCINGKEVRSALRYAGHKIITQAAGRKVLKVFRKDGRKCKGKLLAKKPFSMVDGSDLTIVVTKRFPKKVLIFDNAGFGFLPSAPTDHALMLFRHAADLGPATFKFGATKPEPIEPVSDPLWHKGDQRFRGMAYPVGTVWWLKVTRPNKAAAIAGPDSVELAANRRYERILLGVTTKNAKLAKFSRPILPLDL